ncbi:hypothetical protein JW613_00150 [Streptomyces smyrnaeus]|uniref:Uncharacterized protein n=1 Tax=Streptomyces smyrnaeus TaxID=1387713 RepID=A0ABS3XMU7_9ACTN|nr:hypothetical protein [Streptomyces smyrnaeus]
MTRSGTSTYEGFTAEERAAVKGHAQEQKEAARRTSRVEQATGAERDEREEIAVIQGSDRITTERAHAVVRADAPVLAPRLWYGMPAYALDNKVVCFFQSAAPFKAS